MYGSGCLGLSDMRIPSCVWACMGDVLSCLLTEFIRLLILKFIIGDIFRLLCETLSEEFWVSEILDKLNNCSKSGSAVMLRKLLRFRSAVAWSSGLLIGLFKMTLPASLIFSLLSFWSLMILLLVIIVLIYTIST